jgi:predicted P-loop ATPase
LLKPERVLPVGGAGVAFDTLRAALAAIPNEGERELDYDGWRNVIFAIHSETDGADEGLALAHEFSTRSSKYDADFLDNRVWPYARSDREGGITGRTIVAMAREHGWVEDVSGEFEVVAAKHADEEPLPAFKRDKNGRIEATIENVAMAVRRADLCGMEIRHDGFRDEIMFSQRDDDWRTFSDADYSRLRITLEKSGFKAIGRELIRDVVHMVADDQPFDSAVLWLEGLPWDGVSRVETFLQAYFGAGDTPYTRAVSLYLWTAMAGRVLVPGIKADMVPILVGEQGAAKSSSVAAMVPSPEFFTEVSFHEKDEDLARKMRGRLLAEIGELRGLHTRELESIKAFITRTHENWVPKYKEFATSFPRRLVFIGTTNKDEFLADETGNRRWLPVRTERADIEAVKRDRGQLWAEARELFGLLGVAYQGAEELAKEVHAEHTITDPWAEEIARWLNEPEMLTGEIPQIRDFLQISEVAQGALRIEPKQMSKREEMRISNSLRECGFVRVRRYVCGKQKWVWAVNETTKTT